MTPLSVQGLTYVYLSHYCQLVGCSAGVIGIRAECWNIDYQIHYNLIWKQSTINIHIHSIYYYDMYPENAKSNGSLWECHAATFLYVA